MNSNIQIGNLRRDRHLVGRRGVFRCDRATPLGNQFVMRSEGERDHVCDQYALHFPEALKRREVRAAFDEIVAAARVGPVMLLCWCAPARCHTQTIKEAVEKELRERS